MGQELEYKEFKVVIKDLHSIEVIKPNRQLLSGTVQMDLLREQTIEVFRTWLADGAIAKRRELVLLGSYLYKTLFDGEISEAFRKEFDKVQTEPSTILRLVLEFNREARELAEWPWEYLYYPDSREERGFFIATRTRLVLTRHVPLKEFAKDLKREEKPLRILIVVSQPQNLATVSPEPVAKAIEDLAKRLPDTIMVERLSQPTKRTLPDKVKDFHPHVLHFIGHGKYEGEAGYLALVSEKDQSQPIWINDVDFADCFTDYQPRLIFLHACEGAYTSSYNAFRGVALQLVYSRVPAVVAMQYPITNNVANCFAEKFYESLGKGTPIDVAVQEGRKELGMYLDEEESFSSRVFGSPVVYLQSAEGIIFAATEPAPPSRVPCPYPKCDGSVLPTKRFCPVCRRELMRCPKCGDLMAKEIGFCESCGYTEKQRKEELPRDGYVEKR